MDTFIAIIRELSPLITTIIGAGGIVEFLLTRHDKKHEVERIAEAERRAVADAERKHLRDLTCGVVQDRIVFLCEQAIHQGWISVDKKDIIENLYEPYKALGWNNHARVRVDAMRALPVKEEQED